MPNKASDSARAALAGKCILVLEDEPLIALDLQHALEMCGASVITARTVTRADAHIDAQTPDAAILDVTLGRTTNCEPIARRLLDLSVPFLLHSGDLDRQGELIRRLGAPVVAKPASNDTMITKLATMLVGDTE